MPHIAVRNSGALTIESITWGSVARVTAGAVPGDGVVATRAPPQPASAAIRERQTMLLRVAIDGPQCGVGWLNTATRCVLRPGAFTVADNHQRRDDWREDGAFRPGATGIP